MKSDDTAIKTPAKGTLAGPDVNAATAALESDVPRAKRPLHARRIDDGYLDGWL